MYDEPDGYQSYLLRLWRSHCKGEWQWRASLESPHTGERQVFAGLGQLLAFFEERCDSQICPKGQYPSARRASGGGKEAR